MVVCLLLLSVFISISAHDTTLSASMTTEGLGVDIATVHTEEKPVTHVVMERMLRTLPPHFRRQAHADNQVSPLHRHEIIIAVKNRHLDVLEREVILRATPRDPPLLPSFPSSSLYQQWFNYDEVTAITSIPRATQAVVTWLEELAEEAGTGTIVTTYISPRGDYIRAEAPVGVWERELRSTFRVYAHVDVDVDVNVDPSLTDTTTTTSSSLSTLLRTESYSLPVKLLEHVEAVFNTVQIPPPRKQSHHHHDHKHQQHQQKDKRKQKEPPSQPPSQHQEREHQYAKNTEKAKTKEKEVGDQHHHARADTHHHHRHHHQNHPQLHPHGPRSDVEGVVTSEATRSKDKGYSDKMLFRGSDRVADKGLSSGLDMTSEMKPPVDIDSFFTNHNSGHPTQRPSPARPHPTHPTPTKSTPSKPTGPTPHSSSAHSTDSIQISNPQEVTVDVLRTMYSIPIPTDTFTSRRTKASSDGIKASDSIKTRASGASIDKTKTHSGSDSSGVTGRANSLSQSVFETNQEFFSPNDLTTFQQVG